MILQQNDIFQSGYVDSKAMSALYNACYTISYFTQVTVILLYLLHTRLLLVQNVYFTFRSSDMVHNLYLIALICFDYKFVDRVTSAKSGKHLARHTGSEVLCSRYFQVVLQ